MIFMVFGSVLSLTACGSSEDTGLGASSGESLTDYDAIDAIYSDVEDGALTAEDTTARTGSATLNGAIGLSELGDEGTLTAIGDLVISADFDSDTATGSADGWTLFDEDTDAVESDLGGSLTMTSGTISGTDFDATMSGTLTENSDDFDLSLILDGGFFDNGGDLVVGGDVTGTITNPDGSSDPATGGFAATE